MAEGMILQSLKYKQLSQIYVDSCTRVFDFSPTFPYPEEPLYFKWRTREFGSKYWAGTKIN